VANRVFLPSGSFLPLPAPDSQQLVLFFEKMPGDQALAGRRNREAFQATMANSGTAAQNITVFSEDSLLLLDSERIAL